MDGEAVVQVQIFGPSVPLVMDIIVRFGVREVQLAAPRK